MIDFNDVLPARPLERYDLDDIVARLRATAETWVPWLFPNGRRVGDEWRLANIKGAPPRKQGSCVGHECRLLLALGRTPPDGERQRLLNVDLL
jgi:hypothetical protein